MVHRILRPKRAPLFSLRFREDPTETVITEVIVPPAGSALGDDHLKLIREAADLR